MYSLKLYSGKSVGLANTSPKKLAGHLAGPKAEAAVETAIVNDSRLKKLMYTEKKADKDRKIFFVYGGTDTDIREEIRAITEREENAIIVASYGTFSTGINIRNLHNIIFSSPSKSRIRNLQSIGRGLRIGDNKQGATLYDISDDLTYKERKNFTLTHFQERINIYNEEGFNYEIHSVDLK